ncbi:uncharacterized protein BP5553_00732 [Venustampulla echinocandica]|uniref:Kinesin-like protein n=1 Tax=Venustampulla echinocandica TaxID=2656787 RepID=A0A370TYZ9_9HELO|nr:uncharacterized protein BP5553_00732 [Venustampulla echinocandica]RDL40753.1 hypothetical protein BP5553_00732 [Venustampulla echinocandica]
MALMYFNNIDFYRNLLSSAYKDDEKEDAALAVQIENETLDTMICARIRPLSEEEKEEHHIPGILSNSSSKAVLYEPRQKFNGKPDSVKHGFSLHRVFDTDMQTESVYQEAAQKLVPWAWTGGVSTLFAYGQTGSGKTFTVTGITNLLIKDIMAIAEAEHRAIYVCCFEIFGKKAYDLLDDRRMFNIMEDSFGKMQLIGVQEKHPASEEEFLSIIQTSASLRTSAQTTKNDQSSRSHAVYRIRIVNKKNSEAQDGELFLVDLAGSEGSQDSSKHSAERLVETKDINTSLSILKDCIRNRTIWGLQQLDSSETAKKSIHIPWRSSKLTQVLKHVFGTQEDRVCKTVVIACVAPSIVDSGHSKNTLRYAEMLKVPVPKMKRPKDALVPSNWTNEKMKLWIRENSGTPAIDADILAGKLSGMQLCKMPQKDFISRCLQTTGVEKDQATAFYQKLWRVRIDSRQQSTTFTAGDKSETMQRPSRPKTARPLNTTPFQQRIKPGMCISMGKRSYGALFVVVMSPFGPEDFDGVGDERRFICAVFGPSMMTDAYELHIERQETFIVKDMEGEAFMEYDSATRYYYLDL